jgi:hypothetical protein
VGEAEEISLFFTLIPVLALLSNYDQENRLINVGTEGSTRGNNAFRLDFDVAHSGFEFQQAELRLAELLAPRTVLQTS